MIERARTAMKYFVYGLLIGILFAPRSGEETRGHVMGWLGGLVQGVFDRGGNEPAG